ncbi:unnamed protein product [Adineta steineri]|uniref:Uncharacterized protein n=2 Tax=Adineta steineri TaxID=433720 RepID=A0A814MF14_9BILA|nr:unnamed protein product [Adineta steineri]
MARNPIEVENDFNAHLSKTMDYPIKLHTLKFRALNIQGRGCYELENLLLKFIQSLASLSISMYHRCNNEPDLNYDGYSLSILCRKFLHLRSFHFALQIQMFEKADENVINNFVNTFSTPFWLNGPFGCKRVCVDFEQIYGCLQIFSLQFTFNDTTLTRSIDLTNIQFNTDLEENQTSKHLSQKLETLSFGMDRLLLSFDKNQILSSVFIQALRCPSSQELICWFQLLPNIICLEICLTEFKYWLTNDTNNLYFCSVLQRLERLHVDCSSLINRQMNEEIYHLFLSYIIDKDRFPQLRCLRLRSCKNIASSWENIDQWISFILTHINEHQLTCVRFDFIEQEKKTTEMNICNQIMRIVQLSSIIDIHQFVHDNHIALWIERRYKHFSSTK